MIDLLAARISRGDRRALAQAITLTESRRSDHRREADHLLDYLWPCTGRAIRLAISGPPGAGKSSFIEAFGIHALASGRRLAVLAIDPSSRLSGGSILGDKTRMESLSRQDLVFIRPSPAGETLGGVARRTRDAVALCEAAGFDLVIVETVGVGQSESVAADMVDMFILLLPPAGGDDLQGIKRGIVEVADLLLINKCDGDLTAAAQRSLSDYAHALRLLRPASPDWKPRVQTCSALTGLGIDTAWQVVQEYVAAMKASGEQLRRRSRQNIIWFREEIQARLLYLLEADPALASLMPQMEQKIRAHAMAPTAAAQQVLDALPLSRQS